MLESYIEKHFASELDAMSITTSESNFDELFEYIVGELTAIPHTDGMTRFRIEVELYEVFHRWETKGKE